MTGVDFRYGKQVAVARDAPRYCRAGSYEPSESFPEWSQFPVGSEDNPAFRSVRHALHLLGLDADNYGRSLWNPLASLVAPGQTVFIKPNMVYHENLGSRLYNETDTDSLVTHGSVLRCIVDYAAKALRGRGKIIIGDCPIQGADWTKLVSLTHLDQIEGSIRSRFPGIEVVVRDYRLARARMSRGLPVARETDDASKRSEYQEVDLGRESLLTPIQQEGECPFGVSQYGRSRMKHAHNLQRHAYLIPKDVLNADLFINVPKLKTHQKAAISCALKNLVGINGHKDYLPHFRFGSPREGGDEYPDGGFAWDLLWFLAHKEWEHDGGVRKRLLVACYQIYHGCLWRLGLVKRTAATVGGGGWHGNDTLWRTILDINRAFFYYDCASGRLEQLPRRRKYLAVVDGLVAGHKESPLAPSPLPMGVVMAGTNPAALDAVATTLFGFDIGKVKQVWHAFDEHPMPLVRFSLDEVEVRGLSGVHSIGDLARSGLTVECEPSLGFRGFLERNVDTQEAAVHPGR